MPETGKWTIEMKCHHTPTARGGQILNIWPVGPLFGQHVQGMEQGGIGLSVWLGAKYFKLNK